MELHYYHVDVFTRTPLEGNPLAVFPDATGLEAATMQRIVPNPRRLFNTTFARCGHTREVGSLIHI